MLRCGSTPHDQDCTVDNGGYAGLNVRDFIFLNSGYSSREFFKHCGPMDPCHFRAVYGSCALCKLHCTGDHIGCSCR